MGEISSLVAEAEEPSTPLEQRLNRLAHKLVWVTLAIAVMTALAGITAGKDLYLMIETGIALAVAAVPDLKMMATFHRRGERFRVAIAGYGLLITATVLTAFSLALDTLGLGEREAVTVSFLVLAFAQIWHVFNLRGPGTTPRRNDVLLNPYVWGAVGLCALLLAGAVYVPGLSEVLQVAPLDAGGWVFVLGMSFLPLVVGQLIRVCGTALRRTPAASVLE